MSHIKVHLFPFSIDREGPINTKEYFSVDKNNHHYETIMLGRKLIGTAVPLNNDTTQGHVWEKTITDNYDNEDEEEQEQKSPWIKTNTTIEEFILWKKDTAPNTQDPRINALNDWMGITQTIHEHIPLPTTTTNE